MALGRRNASDRDERFSMAVLALNTSSYRNAVSRLHREVSQEMFHDLWPQLPVWEVPITSITNGVHLPSWLNGDLARALRSVPASRTGASASTNRRSGKQIEDIPDEELLESAPPAQAAPGAFRARAAARVGCAPQGRRRGGAARRRGARSRRVHHRICAAASPPTSAPPCCSATWSGSSGFC